MAEGREEVPVIRYGIDAFDRLVRVCEDWDAFALENGGEAAVASSVTDCHIFDFITGEEWQRIYQKLFARVRKTRQPISFEYRCDSPALVRFMRMNIDNGSEPGQLCLTSETLFQKRRPSRDLSATAFCRVLRTNCGWCGRVSGPDGAWMEIEDAINVMDLERRPVPPLLSPGICPDCAEKAANLVGE